MEKDNPLLPFAFTRSASNLSTSNVHLDTTPRTREVIDENAKSMYHTRTPESIKRLNRPKLMAAPAPSLKRRMGESFNEKDDVKRRVTEFEELESDEPTMIDNTSTDYDDRDHKRSYQGSFATQYDNLPSSPPIDSHFSSEYDSNSKYSIPLSPSQRMNSDIHSTTNSPSKTKPVEGVMIHQLESETDFGIDKFNRFIPTNDCPSTDRDIGSFYNDDKIQALIANKAKEIVINAFEEMKTRIDLSGMGIREVPHEIKDLNNLVVFGEVSTQMTYQLYLSNNKLRVLSPALFKFTKLNVLTLRQNKLDRLPASIKNLVNLTDLSIGTNRLKFLPYQILDLPSLNTFNAGPNPYLKIPESATKVHSVTLNPAKTKKFVGEVKYLKQTDKLVPSLKSIALLKVAKYDVSYQETKEWKRSTPKLYHKLIKHAISQGNYSETCCMCSRLLVEPVAEVIEWWDVLQNRDVPFKKEFCSGMCTQKYKNLLLEDTRANDL